MTHDQQVMADYHELMTDHLTGMFATVMALYTYLSQTGIVPAKSIIPVLKDFLEGESDAPKNLHIKHLIASLERESTPVSLDEITAMFSVIEGGKKDKSEDFDER